MKIVRLRSILICGISMATISSCTINQPYVKYGQEEKQQYSPKEITDSTLQIDVIGLNVDSLVKMLPDDTFIHVMSITCPPCKKKLLALDSLHTEHSLKVINIVVDDWGFNQNVYNIFSGKTKFRKVYILDINKYNKEFSNEKRILQLQQAICGSCSYKTYYFTGYVENGNFKLLQQKSDLMGFFSSEIPGQPSYWYDSIVKLFSVDY